MTTWRTTVIVWVVAVAAIVLGIWWGAALHDTFN